MDMDCCTATFQRLLTLKQINHVKHFEEKISQNGSRCFSRYNHCSQYKFLGMSHGHISPTDKLNLAAVGIGGMGHANINHVKGTENIVALCDVDWKYAKGVFDEFPKAKKYWDYRKMYDEMGKSIDGVIIATADHTHAIITADAMTMGKHVYCQKPLTHSVYESRLLTKLAASTGVVTQMGNQGGIG